jgi:chromosomal replication initiation ATPase DnaA
VDKAKVSPARDAALFAALESDARWILFTAVTPPAIWACTLPDLQSRFSSLTALELQAPDEAMLAALARKLFSDRQLLVPDTVIEAMLRRLDRSPAAIRDFVEQLDGTALAMGRPVSLAIVRNLIAARESGAP